MFDPSCHPKPGLESLHGGISRRCIVPWKVHILNPKSSDGSDDFPDFNFGTWAFRCSKTVHFQGSIKGFASMHLGKLSFFQTCRYFHGADSSCNCTSTAATIQRQY